jgi:glycosyltransferase involved in cell wall biosynthesis
MNKKKEIESPLFTIFTGTYNSEKIIDRVFSSIKNQTVRNFEWIVIDDCSKDNTVDKLEAFVKELSDISVRLIKHKTNTGVGASRKEALSHAKGKYFVTWDHDDIQSEHQLEIFKQLWSKHDAENVGTIFAKIKDQSGKLLGKKYPKEPYISDYINVHNTYLVGNKESGNVVEHHVCAKTEKYKMVLQYFEENPNLLRNHKPNGGDIWGTLAFLGYNTLYTNQIVRTYYISEGGRKTMSDEPRKKSAERIYLYNLKTNEQLFDYLIDPTINNASPLNSLTTHSSRLERDETGAGIGYKIRITEHVKNILNNDFDNVSLGLVVTQNINFLRNSALKTPIDSITRVPSAAVISPEGTVLHGNLSPNAEKRLKFNIYYTETNN